MIPAAYSNDTYTAVVQGTDCGLGDAGPHFPERARHLGHDAVGLVRHVRSGWSRRPQPQPEVRRGLVRRTLTRRSCRHALITGLAAPAAASPAAPARWPGGSRSAPSASPSAQGTATTGAVAGGRTIRRPSDRNRTEIQQLGRARSKRQPCNLALEGSKSSDFELFTGESARVHWRPTLGDGRSRWKVSMWAIELAAGARSWRWTAEG